MAVTAYFYCFVEKHSLVSENEIIVVVEVVETHIRANQRVFELGVKNKIIYSIISSSSSK